MNKKMITFVSIALTAFLLITAAVLITNVSAKNAAVEIPQDVQDQLAQRDQAYNEVIAEANQRIELLNTELAALQATDSPENSSDPLVSPDEAALIALTSINFQEPLNNLPELVDFEGVVAYEVQLTSGKVYVNSRSGEILFSSVQQKINAEDAAMIAGEYLGGLDPRYGVVKQSQLNGADVFLVSFNNYVVTLDQYGTVLQAQVFQYTNETTSSNPTINQNNSSTNTSTSSHVDDDDDDHEDHHEEHEDDDD